MARAGSFGAQARAEPGAGQAGVGRAGVGRAGCGASRVGASRVRGEPGAGRAGCGASRARGEPGAGRAGRDSAQVHDVTRGHGQFGVRGLADQQPAVRVEPGGQTGCLLTAGPFHPDATAQGGR